MPPTISICIPAYNGEAYLRECLDSILRQTFTDFEIIIIDDQSTDSTIAIIEEYIAKDQRVKLFKNPQNLGLVGNWNRCIDLAKGEWIKFVFQDDYIAPTCLEKLLELCKSEDQIVFCNRQFIFESGVSDDLRKSYEQLPSPSKFFGKTTRRITADAFTRAALKDISTNIVGEPTVVMIRKSAFKQFNCFSKNLIQLCDFEYWIRIASNVGIVYVSECLAFFRVHGKSTTSSNKANKEYRLKLDRLFILADILSKPEYENLRTIAQSYSINIHAMAKQDAYFEWIRFSRAAKVSPEVKLVEKDWQNLFDEYPNFPKVSHLRSIEKFIFMIRRRVAHMQWQTQRFFS